MPYPPLWIQSLLLLSARRSPAISFVHEQKKKEPGLLDEEIVSGEVISSYPDSGLTFAHTFQQTTVTAPPNMPSPETFWPLTIQPAASFLEVVGNGFVTSYFPVQVHGVLQAIVCGNGSAEFSWSLDGPYDENRQPARLITSQPHFITWTSLAFFSQYRAPESLKICQIKKAISFLAQEPGLFLITARLNGQEASYLPLVISPSTSENVPDKSASTHEH